jgi:hypothetical protein
MTGTMKMTRLLALTALVIAMSCWLQTAAAGETSVLVTSPEQISINRPEQAVIAIVANEGFDGVVMVNASGCNVSPDIFGFSKLEYRQEAGRYVYYRSLVMLAIERGNYSLTVRVLNLTNSEIAVSSAGGIADYFDKQAPLVVSMVPSGIVRSAYVNITVMTNEFAVCRMDRRNVSFDAMNIQLSDYGQNHYSMLELGLGRYLYYVCCRDLSGNTMVPIALEFEVNPPPSAIIELSDPSPVKAGIVEITLESSEPLRSTPSLSYDFDGGETKPISLTGSNDRWTGYLVIDDSNDQKIGTFHFSGIDLQSDVGTTITQGGIFIVDTKKPPAPQSLKATASTAIELEWYYDGEEVDHFNVYRSLSPGVGLSNYFAKSNLKRWDDLDTVAGTIYYYRVSTVDAAGNEGGLSDEAGALSKRPIQSVTTSDMTKPIIPERQILLSYPLVLTVNKSLNYLGKIYLDTDGAKRNLASSSDPDMQRVVTDLGLMEEVDSARARLDQYQSQLKELWYMDLTEKELGTRLNNILQKIDSLRKSTPSSVEIDDRSVVTQAYTEQLFDEAAYQLLLGYTLDQNQTKTYKAINLRLQNDFRVTIDAKNLRIAYLDGSAQNVTLIEKEISYTGIEGLQNVRVVEIVPKTVARATKEVNFISTGYEILKDDPIVAWKLDRLESKTVLKYSVERRVPLEEAKNAATFVLLEPRTEAPKTLEGNETGSAVTGYTVTEKPQRLFSPTETIMIIVSLVFVMGLAVYYFVFSGASIEDMMAEQQMRKYMRRAKRLEEEATRIEMAREDYAPMESENNYIYTNVLLKRANELIEAKQYHQALTVYNMVKEIYPRLEQAHKIELYDRCVDIFRQLESARKK